jgi:hypothetical protein
MIYNAVQYVKVKKNYTTIQKKPYHCNYVMTLFIYSGKIVAPSLLL